MDVSHAETADARRLIGQCLLVRVQPQVHNMATAEGMNVRKLLFGRLTGRRDPVVKSLPVVDCLRVGHQTPLTAETRAEDDPRPGSFTSSRFQKATLLERRDAIVETDLFRDLAILDTEYGCPGEPHLATGCRRKRADEEIAERRPGVRAATLPPAHDVITHLDYEAAIRRRRKPLQTFSLECVVSRHGLGGDYAALSSPINTVDQIGPAIGSA